MLNKCIIPYSKLECITSEGGKKFSSSRTHCTNFQISTIRVRTFSVSP